MISDYQQHLCCLKCETLPCPPQQLSTRINFTRSTLDTRLWAVQFPGIPCLLAHVQGPDAIGCTSPHNWYHLPANKKESDGPHVQRYAIPESPNARLLDAGYLESPKAVSDMCKHQRRYWSSAKRISKIISESWSCGWSLSTM